MSLTIRLVLIVIAALLMALAAFGVGTRVDLFKLGWAVAILSLIAP